MSLLSKATTGKVFKPYIVTIFGPEGVGKSTFGAEAPNPIFACTEDGSNHLDVIRLPRIETFQMVMEAIGEKKRRSYSARRMLSMTAPARSDCTSWRATDLPSQGTTFIQRSASYPAQMKSQSYSPAISAAQRINGRSRPCGMAFEWG